MRSIRRDISAQYSGRTGLPKSSTRRSANREHDARRRANDPARNWYKTKRWAARRSHQLATHPLCCDCDAEGVIAPATVADHDPPHRGNQFVFFNGPLKSRCKPHHDKQKQREERAGYSDSVDADLWPTDPNHPANARPGVAGDRPAHVQGDGGVSKTLATLDAGPACSRHTNSREFGVSGGQGGQ